MSQIKGIIWTYCSGHTRVRGNERAGALAGNATVGRRLSDDQSQV